MRNILKALIISGSVVALSGCAYGSLGGLDVGYGYGSPYGSYGSSIGYGSAYGGYGGYGSYGSPYGSYGGYGSPYGYGSGYGGYGSPYFGWYDNYYYPGTGYYVYDSYRRPHAMNDTQRRYWTNRAQTNTAQPVTQPSVRPGTRPTYRQPQTTTPRPALRENWSGFKTNRATARTARQDTTNQRRRDTTPH